MLVKLVWLMLVFLRRQEGLFRVTTFAAMPARSRTARKVSCHPAVQLDRADKAAGLPWGA